MTVLFHQNLVVAVLGSGSRGNCTYIGDGREGVLIDCGVSTKQIFSRLEEVGLADAPVDAVLVTHDHSDHVSGAGVLDRRLERRRGTPVSFHMTAGTRKSLHADVTPRNVVLIEPGTPFRIGRIRVEPFVIPHDTLDPVAYVLHIGPTRVAIVTDLGSTPKLVEHYLASVDVAVLEFNHDLEMLLQGSYPWPLKQRIRGTHGHLSNAQAARLIERVAPKNLRHLVLAHLSEENNVPEKALAEAHAALARAGLRNVKVDVGAQDRPILAVSD